MNIIGMRVKVYKGYSLKDVKFTGVVVGLSRDEDSDPVFVVLKDDNTFGVAFVGNCKKED